jgi:hypothetical protein
MFKRILVIVAAVFLAASMALAAESPFIGEWKLNPSKTRLPDEMKVQSEGGNRYSFDFAGTPETIVADGSDQPGVGGTLLSVKMEAPDTWIVQRKKDGRLLLKATWKLSKDGRTLADYFRQFSTDGSTTLSIDYVYQRTGEGSGFAAEWRSIKETMNSSYVMQVKEFEGDGLSFINPTAQRTKNLKFDGKDHPNVGPTSDGSATASIRRVDARNLVITDKASGTVVATEEVALSEDLKTLTMTVHLPGRDKPNVMVFERL